MAICRSGDRQGAGRSPYPTGRGGSDFPVAALMKASVPAVKPPSTGSVAPFTNEASGEARYSAAFAISIGRPRRLTG